MVAFVDEALDKEKSFYGHDDFMKRFMYVSSKEDVVKRINGLKARPEIRDIVLKKQQEMASFSIEQWANDLADMIES